MKQPFILLLSAALTWSATSCRHRTSTPRFETLTIDTLVQGNGYTCDIDFRYTSIANAEKSPVLRTIEHNNRIRFFDLATTNGSAAEDAATAIEQTLHEIAPPADNEPRLDRAVWKGILSADSEAELLDTVLCYTITRSSYLGGAHGMYSTEYINYSLNSGLDISLADLFSESEQTRLDTLILRQLMLQYQADGMKGLAEKGFFPQYIHATENFRPTPTGILFCYNPYDIGCYALGCVEVELSRETLESQGFRRFCNK